MASVSPVLLMGIDPVTGETRAVVLGANGAIQTAPAAQDLTPLIAGMAGPAGSAKTLADLLTKLNTGIYQIPNPQVPTAYRSGLVAADVMAPPGTVTATKIAGSSPGMAAAVYYFKVVAGNLYGRTTPVASTPTTITTETTNLRVNLAFAQVAGATFYDIYASVDTDPKFTARITEAQRAAGGFLISTHNTLTAGTAAAGSVDVAVIGTGLQPLNTAAANCAFLIPASPINCAGYQYCDFDISLSRSGDDVSPSLVVAPFFQNVRNSAWYQGASVAVPFGGYPMGFTAMQYRIRVEVRGCAAVALLIQNLSGTGASVNIDALLS